MKENSPFHIQTSNSITAIDKKDWDSVFPQVPENYNFFRTIEETLCKQFKLSYISLYEEREIICVAPCFIIDYALDTTVEGPWKKLVDWLKHRIPKLFTIRVLVCGCPMSEGKIGLKYSDRPEILTALLDALSALAEDEKSSLIAFKDFPEEYLTLFKPFLKDGFHIMHNFPATEIDMHFSSFEEYLSSLGKATRKNIKRKFREVARRIKIDMEVTNKLQGAALDKVYELYLNTLNKSEVQFEILTKEFFRKICDYLPQETKYFPWRIDGELVAFDLCLSSHGILIDEYIGLDYRVAYQHHLYYVTVRDVFTWCLENNIRRFQGGTLNYDPKKRLDFKFIPQYIFVKHRHKFMNFVFGVLCKILKPENFDPVLKSMKKKPNLFFLKVFTLIFAADIAESVADLFFKKGVLLTGIDNVTVQNFIAFTLQLLGHPLLWFGIFFYFLNFLLWIVALSKVDLSVAFPIGSTTYVIVPILAMIFLHEKVIWTQWLGIVFIIIGIYFISQSKQETPGIP